jgi:glycosyltransferase involved in cell wall biosynthesis
MKLAVCIIVENLPVPVDRRVWREACALRDAGYGVSVICPKGNGFAEASHENLDGIEIYRHRSWPGRHTTGYILEYAWAFIAELYLALRVFARTRFRILQACNPPDTIFLIALLLRPLGVRFVFDHHDLAPELFETKFGRRRGLLYRITQLLEACSFRAARVCIATNESFKEIAVSRGGKRNEDVFVVRNCPDMSDLGRHSVLSSRDSKFFVVVYVGFMGPQDGLELLIESIQHIVHREKRNDVRFVFVGGGSELLALQRMVVERELESFVTFVGQVSYDEVAKYLSDADIGVAPDPKTPMNDKSTMIKLLEYMAYGLPIVLFDLKEGRRVAGSAALYASPNDPIDFANQITKLLNCHDLRRELGSWGRRRVEERLNWGAEKAVLLQAYEAALK